MTADRSPAKRTKLSLCKRCGCRWRGDDPMDRPLCFLSCEQSEIVEVSSAEVVDVIADNGSEGKTFTRTVRAIRLGEAFEVRFSLGGRCL
jgi:hypothetical protein